MSPTDSDADGGRSVSDGGTPSPSDPDILTRTSDTPKLTRRKRLFMTFDKLILGPLRVSLQDYRMIISVVIIFSFVFTGYFGTRFVEEPSLLQGEIFAGPTFLGGESEYILGTDNKGRSVFGMLVYSTPAMLEMVVAGGLLSVVLGSVIGAISGYSGGLLDKILMSLTDAVLTIPSLALVIVLASVWTPANMYEVGILLGIDNWPGLARTVRSQVLSIREQSYTEASRAMGLSRLTILRKDVLSDLAPYITVNLASGSRRIIFESVALYYLGVLPYTSQNWGIMLNNAYDKTDFTALGEYHWVATPMIAIILLSLGLILLAQSADRVFNVRLRAQNQETAEGTGAESLE